MPCLGWLSSSDDELSAVMEAARPIPPRDRDAFLRDVASELDRPRRHRARHSQGPALPRRAFRVGKYRRIDKTAVDRLVCDDEKRRWHQNE
jgi:hypothetical protein